MALCSRVFQQCIAGLEFNKKDATDHACFQHGVGLVGGCINRQAVHFGVTVEEARIQNLEQRTAVLGETINRVEGKVDNIVDTLNSLVRIEERQIAINARLAEGAQTMQNHEGRIKNMEVVMPGLIEKSGWMVAGLLGVIGVVGMQILHMVLK